MVSRLIKLSIANQIQLTTVPGGQDLYVNVNGRIAITVQHSHSIPPGAWWNYYGWTWTALPVHQRPLLDCPKDDPEYKCEPPTGYWNFQAPNATVGGVMLVISRNLRLDTDCCIGLAQMSIHQLLPACMQLRRSSTGLTV